MKKWTVVIEFNGVQDDVPKSAIDEAVSNCLSDELPSGVGFRIMEVIPAPYGPQHPGGVFIAEMKCICRKGSSFVNPNCKATVHHP